MNAVRGCFVTGTDTDAGKTVAAAAITAGLRAAGAPVRALKPILTGLDDPRDDGWPHDHLVLAAASGVDPATIALRTFGPPVSPHLAAELAGVTIDVERVIEEILATPEDGELLVVEGIGGVLVPLAPGWDVRRLAAALELPVVIAARPGLGTISHTLLTLEATRAAGLRVLGVVLTPWPDDPGTIERSNAETIAELGSVEVALLPFVDGADPGSLALAGARLPLGRWLIDPCV
jgi:dethiobiotin synthetase